jgi:vacuolar-type H+-ATPase subunit I/STV1
MGALAELYVAGEMVRGIGDNNGPDLIDFSRETMADLSSWMAEHPIIDGEDVAREAKKLLDRAKSCAGDIEAERDKLVRPLNEQITEINARYKSVHNTDSKRPGILDKVVSELKARLAVFLKAEEDRRAAEAEAKRLAAEEAERIAREAEAREREAIENAKAGELGVDVTQVVIEADSRFAEFKKADREAARADRDSHVRIGGGWGRSASLRNKETLVLENYNKAITAIGPHPKIEEAILSAAREYRKTHDKLPAGVTAVFERQL